ncbi:MAG: hypothetical protein QM676_10040 [Novosphingobium sp.]
MNRFLLTLLALLTGLAAQVSPAQAALQAAEEAEVGSVQAVRAAVRLARQVAVCAAGESSVPALAERHDAAVLPRFGLAWHAVRIGIDRARQ